MADTGLGPLRVLDLTDELAFQGARLLVGLGADVLRVDPGQGGDLAARVHWHAGKRWVRAGDDAELDAVAAGADVVLESGPAATLRGVRADGVSRWPHAVHVVVTPFGLTGPRRDWLADDLVLASAGGMTWLGGRADGPPKPPPCEQAVQVAGAHAAIAALLGVLARDQAGSGQLVDISGPGGGRRHPGDGRDRLDSRRPLPGAERWRLPARRAPDLHRRGRLRGRRLLGQRPDVDRSPGLACRRRRGGRAHRLAVERPGGAVERPRARR